jgi:hypothetical protein
MKPRHTSRAALAAIVLSVVALVLAGLASPASAAASTGTLKGVVTLSGSPVKNAKVQLYTHLRSEFDDSSFAYDRVKTVSTDSKGRYSFNGVKSGTWNGGPKYLYAVLVTDRSGKGAKTLRYVDVKKGRTTTRKVGLKPAVILTGSVARSDGGSPAELVVNVSSNETRNDTDPLNQEFYPDSTTPVRSNGTFTVEGLAAGEFQVVVKGDAYLAQCYDFDTSTLEECRNRPGTDIVLKAGERRTLAPVVATKVAPPVATVTGKVTDTTGRSLKGVEVTVRQIGKGQVGGAAVTRSSGRFSYKGRLPAGTYAVRYDDPKHVWASQYRGGRAQSVSRTFEIVGGETIRSVDDELKSSTNNQMTYKSGRGFIEMTFSLTRRVSGGRPSGTMTLTSDGTSQTAVVRKGKVTVRLTGLPGSRHEVHAAYSGTSNTAGFTRSFSPR